MDENKNPLLRTPTPGQDLTKSFFPLYKAKKKACPGCEEKKLPKYLKKFGAALFILLGVGGLIFLGIKLPLAIPFAAPLLALLALATHRWHTHKK